MCEWPYIRSVLSPRLLNNHASFIFVRLPFVHRRFLQDRSPRTHTIIEAHPDVYAACARKGWDKKEGVRVLHGRWQEVLAREMISQDGCVRLCVAARPPGGGGGRSGGKKNNFYCRKIIGTASACMCEVLACSLSRPTQPKPNHGGHTYRAFVRVGTASPSVRLV